MANAWKGKPTAYTKVVEAELSQTVRKAAFFVLRSLIVSSPVDTGRFKGNWQVGIGEKVTGVTERLDKGGAVTLQAGLSVIKSKAVIHNLWISNNLPYAERIENGWSTQAPSGVVALAMRKAERAGYL